MNDQNRKLKDEIHLVYVGTYTDGDSEGIYIYQLDMSTGELRQIGVARNVDNPSYLVIDAARQRLYAVNELSNYGGRPGGGVSSFAIQATGELSFINQQFSHGGAPCYLTLDRTGRYLFAVNYSGGNVVVMPISEDGELREPSDIVGHSGSGLNPERQEGPHPHSIILDHANNYAFVPDLGLDKVMQYHFDRDKGRLCANQRPWIEARPGSGPRHMVFHPNRRCAYVINELSSTIAAYAYDSTSGTLETLQIISTVPEEYSGANLAADLHLSPNGKFLYGSNRGHDSIAIYAVDQATGWLAQIDCIATQGRVPRGFAIDSTGTFLLAANQDSHELVTFRIDQEKGVITPTGYRVQIPSPVCLKLMSLASN
jgi:6-phosphogluconolactonase